MSAVIKEIQHQKLTAFPISLEDALLKVLYTSESGMRSAMLAEELGISESAVFSIINRIKLSYPRFILITKGEEKRTTTLYAGKGMEHEVQLFLAQGGFTALNEQERKAFEQAEVREAIGLQLKKKRLKKQSFIAMAAGAMVTIGVLTLLIKIRREK